MKVLAKTDFVAIKDHLICIQLRWTGHIIHVPQICLSEQILYSKLSSINYKHRKQMKCFKDLLKQNLPKTNISDSVFEQVATDCIALFHTIRVCVHGFEKNYIAHLEAQHQV